MHKIEPTLQTNKKSVVLLYLFFFVTHINTEQKKQKKASWKRQTNEKEKNPIYKHLCSFLTSNKLGIIFNISSILKSKNMSTILSIDNNIK